MNQDTGSKIIVYSPYPLSKDEIQLIKEKFSLQDREIINLVKEDILSGVVIIFDGKRIDLSLKTMLKNLKTDLYGFS